MNMEDRLREAVTLQDPGLAGCRRRNVWSKEDKDWRFIRGNAVLAAVGTKTHADTPVGRLEFFTADSELLQFRGGEWSGTWMEDFIDLWCLATEYGEDRLDRRVMIFLENKGHLTITSITVPIYVDIQERCEKIISEYQSVPPGRISKHDGRALRLCKYCPVRTLCNSTDKLHHETNDWSAEYRTTLG